MLSFGCDVSRVKDMYLYSKQHTLHFVLKKMPPFLRGGKYQQQSYKPGSVLSAG